MTQANKLKINEQHSEVPQVMLTTVVAAGSSSFSCPPSTLVGSPSCRLCSYTSPMVCRRRLTVTVTMAPAVNTPLSSSSTTDRRSNVNKVIYLSSM
ncbi:hypothetical protein E2C01_015702 [Portunus trituberculatus]|uniref:Uncharacterized protein n=1 Tax=Portunus trituberculatus TaxID=210409 RepID=A0A5B7DM95_PORTR|nr:hypothetical protein [Portunus trituberculatus]